MADGLGYTEGSGKTVATDDCGAVGHVQVFKLAYSADGDSTLLTADAHGLLVRSSTSSTVTRSSVSAAASDTLILAANTARKGATIYNDCDKVLYLALGTTAASATNFTALLTGTSSSATSPGGYFEVPANYTGQIRGIWATGPTGSARVSELT